MTDATSEGTIMIPSYNSEAILGQIRSKAPLDGRK